MRRRLRALLLLAAFIGTIWLLISGDGSLVGES
jgi:glycerol uptake facilitator-like aquaporin